MNKVRYSKTSDINSLESLIQASFVLIVSYLNLLSNNYQKKKSRKQFHLQLHQKNKMPRNKFN